MPQVNSIVLTHIIVWLISGAITGILAAIVARGKGQSALKWFFMGVIAPFVSLIGVAITEKTEGNDFRLTDRAYKVMRRWYAVLISFVVFIVYAQTAQPTVPFWDCGEFIACSFSLSVPHPPGATLFLLLGRIVSLLPLDFLAPLWGLEELTVAHKLNLMSGFFNATTIGVIFMIISRAAEKFFLKANSASEYAIVLVSGLVGGLLAAFSSTYWGNAVEAEVYGPAMFITALVLYVAMLWYEKRDKPDSDRYLVFIAYMLYLGISIHLTVMIMLPPVFLFVVFSSVRKRRDPIFWFTWILLFTVATTFKIFLGMSIVGLAVLLLGFIIAGTMKHRSLKAERATRSFGIGFVTILVCVIAFGISTYTLIRSQLNPPIDENNPETVEGFADYMDRKQYGQESMWESMFNRKGTWVNQIGVHPRMGFWGFFEKQWSTPLTSLRGTIPFFISLLGLFIFFPKHKQFWLLLFLALLVSTLGLIIYINFSDGTQGIKLEVRDRDYFFTPGYMFFSAWIGLGLAALLAMFNKLRRSVKLPASLTLILCSILTLLPAIPLKANWFTHDRSKNYIPHDYAFNILNSCDKNSILYTNGDNDTFPLWFLQVVKGERADVCIANLSLLNTNWYIKQLKTRNYYKYTGTSSSGGKITGTMEAESSLDLNRKLSSRNITLVSSELTKRINQFGHDFVPIKMTDDQIDLLRAYRTSDGSVVRVQDIMVKHLIDHTQVTVTQDTIGEKIDTNYVFTPPIYFAVTVSPDNKLNYGPYLRMEGLAYRLTGQKGDRQVEPEIMRDYLFDTYFFRGLKDDKIYKDENSAKLLQNYTTAFMTLALDLRAKGRMDESKEVMEGAIDMLPYDWRIAMFAADIFADVGNWERFDELLETSLQEDPTNIRLIRLFADLCYQYGDTSRTLDIIEKGRIKNPEDDVLFKSQLGYLYSFGETGKFNEEITAWHEKHPDDEKIKSYFESIQKTQPSKSKMIVKPGTKSTEEVATEKETQTLPSGRE
ncbi:DUF2723 domain-containing protein [bacterium]|nr:DUF2723 domain-containing protein [bacterium]